MSQDQLMQEFKSTTAQLEAHKGMLNEQLQMNIHFRTNIVLLQQALQDAAAKIAELEKKVAEPKPTPITSKKGK